MIKSQLPLQLVGLTMIELTTQAKIIGAVPPGRPLSIMGYPSIFPKCSA